MSLSSDLLPGVPIIESPLFDASLNDMGLTETERAVAVSLKCDGYAVFDFPDPAINARCDRIKTNLAPRYNVDFADPAAIKTTGGNRIQDAWAFDEDVKALADNPAILELLSKLYGRRAFPFQTLNFPVGTQQHPHTDSVHFSSQPERFMCGVWVALEDIAAEAGPLLYYRGSHRWPVLNNAMIGRRGWGADRESAQAPFEAVWRAQVDAHHLKPTTFLARKGQALIWAANLLHGGSLQTDPTRTRWSQVTHYYFADCIYYTPAFSDEALGRFDLRTITNIATGAVEPCRLMGEEVGASAGLPPRPPLWHRLLARWNRPGGSEGLPTDFDPEIYYRLNPDVPAGHIDAATHYVRHGKAEGRRYRTD